MKHFLTLAIMCALVSCGGAKSGDNPFFTQWEGQFELPPFDEIHPGHFEPAFKEGMRRQRAEIDSIAGSIEIPTFDNTILAYDRSGAMLSRVARVFGTLTSADTTPELEKIKTALSPLQSAHSDAIALDERLFRRIKAVYDSRFNAGLNEAQIRLTERVYDRFRRNGALLDGAQKEELRKINEELAMASIRFESNNREALNGYVMTVHRREEVDMPQGVVSRAVERARELGKPDSMAFTLSKPSWIPFLTYNKDPELRKRLYDAYLNQCAAGTQWDNSGVINDIIRLRTAKAKLLGFETFAHFVLDERMAGTPERVYEFLDEIWEPALYRVRKERDALRNLKRREIGDGFAAMDAFDWWFYAEKLRKERYHLDEEQTRPYFALENVRTGIFTLCNTLYGISFRPIADAPVYNKDVVVYEVLDADNSHLGVVYMDFFPRAGKGSGAWCSSLRSQGYTPEGEKIHPITTITCNFTEPVGDTPSLLTLDETETFFHEFGHAIHNLFADVPYEGLLGTERDFVELPSQIMENWAFAPQMLDRYAIHYQTGEKIPDELVRRIVESSQFNQGFMTAELLAASLSDMDVHTQAVPPFDVAEFERVALREKRRLIPEVEPRYRYPYFSHIFDGGYAAGYYSYIWAEVLDKDAFEAFVESGDIFSRTVANDFRYKVLAPRGLRNGMELFLDFRGAEPSREPLLRGRGLLADSVRSAVKTEREGLVPAPPDSVLRAILNEPR